MLVLVEKRRFQQGLGSFVKGDLFTRTSKHEEALISTITVEKWTTQGQTCMHLFHNMCITR